SGSATNNWTSSGLWSLKPAKGILKKVSAYPDPEEDAMVSSPSPSKDRARKKEGATANSSDDESPRSPGLSDGE
ncbi:unnamed protein product, partial [Amoebophrya sp. A25]